MHQDKFCNKWTQEHINYLKMAYLEGSPLKKIAAKLNRSVSAINKVLSRHNLRTHTRFTLSRPSTPASPQQKAGRIKPSKHVSVIVPLSLENRQWVLFEQVIRWLRSQNISAIKSPLDIYYEVNGIPKNKQQVLLMANLLREDQQLPIFFVKGISN